MRLRRIVSGLCAAVMILTTTASLAACGKKESSIYINMGQWLEMVNDSFGMSSYTTGEPYFENVVNGDPYFGAVQTAAEWNVIDTEDTEFDPSKTLCWGDALLTLVNVGEFVDESASDEEKINYAIENFDSSIRDYWMDREIEVEKAIPLLTTAQDLWANKKYDQKIEKVTYAEGVIDLSTFDTPVKTYDVNGNVVTIPTQQEYAVSDTGEKEYTNIGADDLGIESGDIYILPPTEDNREVTAYKADNVVEEDGNIIIDNSDEDLDLYEVAQDIKVQDTFEPMMENVVVYDGNGEMISNGENITSQMRNEKNDTDINIFDAQNYSLDNLITQTADGKVSYSFKAGDFEVKLSYNLNGKMNFSTTIQTPQSKNSRCQLSGSYEISDVSITKDVDYSWFTLHSATIKIDYTQKKSGKFTWTPVDKIAAPKYSNGNGKFLNNLSRGLKNWKQKDNEGKVSGAKSIKVASLDIYNFGIGRVTFDLVLNLKIDGSVEVTLTERGSKGIEYKDGNLRTINTSDKSRNIQIKANIEFTADIGPSLYLLCIKKPIVNVSVVFGLGSEFSVTWHLATPEGHLIEEYKPDGITPENCDALPTAVDIGLDQIQKIAQQQGGTYSNSKETSNVSCKIDWCADISAYFILKIKVGSSYISDLLNGKVKLEWEIFGSENAKFARLHIEDGNWNFALGSDTDICTKEYTPFDQAESTNDSDSDSSMIQNEDSDIAKGDRIVISQLKGAIYPNGNTVLLIEQVPAGYSLGDIRFESDDTSVATVDSSGVVTGNKPGTAMIKVYTSDEKHIIVCSIVVLEAESKAA